SLSARRQAEEPQRHGRRRVRLAERDRPALRRRRQRRGLPELALGRRSEDRPATLGALLFETRKATVRQKTAAAIPDDQPSGGAGDPRARLLRAEAFGLLGPAVDAQPGVAREQHRIAVHHADQTLLILAGAVVTRDLIVFRDRLLHDPGPLAAVD